MIKHLEKSQKQFSQSRARGEKEISAAIGELEDPDFYHRWGREGENSRIGSSSVVVEVVVVVEEIVVVVVAEVVVVIGGGENSRIGS